jgi:microcystin-dependent protein
MAEPFVGEIRLFTFKYAPRGWATCDGQLLTVAQNTALYSLLNITFGGNVGTNFQLPDLRGRVPVSLGGPKNYQVGTKDGLETVALTEATAPPHTHRLNATKQQADKPGATGRLFAETKPVEFYAVPQTNKTVTLAPASIGQSGGGKGHENMQPFLTINFCIALVGFYPPHN